MFQYVYKISCQWSEWQIFYTQQYYRRIYFKIITGLSPIGNNLIGYNYT